MGRVSGAREQLVESAKQLMAERGFTAVGINEICERAGVKKGSFYYFFPSKRDLAIEAIDSHWQDHEERLARALEEDAPLLERIRRFVQSHYELHRLTREREGCVKGCPFANLAVELSTRDEAIRSRLEMAFERWTARFEPVIEEAMRSGEIPEGDAGRTARELVAYFEGTVLLAKTCNDPEVIRDLEPGLLRLLGSPGKERHRREASSSRSLRWQPKRKNGAAWSSSREGLKLP